MAVSPWAMKMTVLVLQLLPAWAVSPLELQFHN